MPPANPEFSERRFSRVKDEDFFNYAGQRAMHVEGPRKPVVPDVYDISWSTDPTDSFDPSVEFPDEEMYPVDIN